MIPKVSHADMLEHSRDRFLLPGDRVRAVRESYSKGPEGVVEAVAVRRECWPDGTYRPVLWVSIEGSMWLSGRYELVEGVGT